MKKCIVLTLVLATIGASACAESAWHYFSARLYGGVVDNGGTLDSRPGYRELDMGSEAIYGIAFDTLLTDNFALKFDLSKFSNSAMQQSSDPEFGGDQLSVSLDVTTLSVTGKRRFNPWDGLVSPWLGVGIDMSVIEVSESEMFSTSGGSYAEDGKSKVSNGLGAHAAVGLDIYPVKDSALALMMEARYTAYSSSGPFKGNLNGAMFLVGLKWDFGQRAQ